MIKITRKLCAATAVLALSAVPAVAATSTGAFYPLAEEATSLALPVQDTIEGTWSTRARVDDDGDRHIRLSMELDENHGNWGWRVDPEDLDGLTYQQFDGDVDDARFELVRDAGTMAFEGRIRDGRGAGTFVFTPDSQWVSQMDGMGYDLSSRQVFTAAVHDITTDYVSELGQLGYDDLETGKLFSFAIHGVSTDFIRGMNGLGYADIEAGKLITMRIHGVTPEWVREVRDAMGG